MSCILAISRDRVSGLLASRWYLYAFADYNWMGVACLKQPCPNYMYRDRVSCLLASRRYLYAFADYNLMGVACLKQPCPNYIYRGRVSGLLASLSGDRRVIAVA